MVSLVFQPLSARVSPRTSGHWGQQLGLQAFQARRDRVVQHRLWRAPWRRAWGNAMGNAMEMVISWEKNIGKP